jgi:type IV secretion system protein VirB2
MPGIRKLRKSAVLYFAFVAALVALLPEDSHAGAIEDGAKWVLDVLTGAFARTCAIISVAVLGYMAWFREFDKAKAVWIVVGIVAVFGGASIVDLIIGAVS